MLHHTETNRRPLHSQPLVKPIMKIRSLVRLSFHGLPLIPIAMMSVAIAAAVLAANTTIQNSVTIQTFQMQATTVSGGVCTATVITSVSYGIVPSSQPLPNANFCLTNTSPSQIYTGGATITGNILTVSSGSLPPGVTQDWVVGASSNPGCVGLSVPTSLTINAIAGSNAWTVTNSKIGACNTADTVSYFTLANTGTSSVPGTYTWTDSLNSFTTATG